MEVKNEADRIKRKIIWKNIFIVLLIGVALFLFLKLVIEIDLLDDKKKMYLEIATPSLVAVALFIAWTEKKDKKDWEEADKYFHPERYNNGEPKQKTNLDMLREASQSKMKSSALSELGIDDKDKNENGNGNSESQSTEQEDTTLIGSKAKVSSDGRVSGIGEYKFTPPGKCGINGKKDIGGFGKFNTGVRSDSTLTGQTGSILDRYKND